MIKKSIVTVLCALLVAGAAAQTVPDADPLSLDEIKLLRAQPLSRDEVLSLVSGVNVEWAAANGGERRWTNDPSGNFWATRIGTGVGSFNPHHKSGKGSWMVREDGAYCVHLDYGHMLIEDYCWLFFATEGHIVMNMQPAAGGRIRFYK